MTSPIDSAAREYRKKPVVIQAIHLTPELFWECHDDPTRMLFGRFRFYGTYHSGRREIDRAWISIDTLEGTMRADLGDYLVCGVKGEFYPCKPDIFEQTNELAHL